MYRLYYSCGHFPDTYEKYEDSSDLKTLYEFIAEMSWSKHYDVHSMTTNIKREDFWPKEIVKITEEEIADENDQTITAAIEKGRLQLRAELEPIIEQENKRKEELEKAQLNYLKAKYEH